MHKTMKVTIEGSAPLILHNGNLANPLAPIPKLMKSFSSKRSKTDEDFQVMSQLEWVGGLYTVDDISDLEIVQNQVVLKKTSSICIPGDVLEGVLVTAAKKHKLGNQAKAGMMVDQDWILDFPDKKKHLSDLMADQNYVDIRKVRVQQNSVMRTRPIFREWSLDFEIKYLPDVIDPNRITDILNTAGAIVGLCEYRPKYGRFSVA